MSKDAFIARIAAAILAGRAKTRFPIEVPEAELRARQVAAALPALFQDGPA
jgi:hypothetical protein